MTQFLQDLNTDQNDVATSSQYGDLGDTSNGWFMNMKLRDGANVTQGTKADEAVTDPTLSGSLIGILKGLLNRLNLLVAGFKTEDSVHSSGDTGIAVWGVRNDTLTDRVSTDGDYGPIAMGSAGQVFITPTVTGMVTAGAPTNVSTAAYSSSLVVKTTPGRLLAFTGYNALAAVQFLQVHDAATLPADAAVPKVVIAVPASSSFAVNFGLYGRQFATGIVICNSTTGPTKTLGAATCWFDVQFK